MPAHRGILPLSLFQHPDEQALSMGHRARCPSPQLSQLFLCSPIGHCRDYFFHFTVKLLGQVTAFLE